MEKRRTWYIEEITKIVSAILNSVEKLTGLRTLSSLAWVKYFPIRGDLGI